jgi:hypothetical protein
VVLPRGREKKNLANVEHEKTFIISHPLTTTTFDTTESDTNEFFRFFVS